MSWAFMDLVKLVGLVSLVGLVDAEVRSSDVDVNAETRFIPSQTRFVPRLAANRAAPFVFGGRGRATGMRPMFPEMSLEGRSEEKGTERVFKPEAGQSATVNELQRRSAVKGITNMSVQLIRSVFKSFDSEGSGLLEGEQLMGALRALRLDPMELRKNVFATEAGVVIDHEDLAFNYDEFFDVVLTIVTGAPPQKKVLSQRSAVTADATGVFEPEVDQSEVKDITNQSVLVIRSVFESFDSEGSGLLEGEQLMGALQALHLDPRELQKNVFATETGLVIDYEDLAINYDDFYDIVLTTVTGAPSQLKVLSRRSAATADAAGSFMPLAAQAWTADQRILLAWIALDQLAPDALEKADWYALAAVWQKAENSLIALPLYNPAIEGTEEQKELHKDAIEYESACSELGKAIHDHDIVKARLAVKQAHDTLLTYRSIAQDEQSDSEAGSLPEDGVVAQA